MVPGRSRFILNVCWLITCDNYVFVLDWLITQDDRLPLAWFTLSNSVKNTFQRNWHIFFQRNSLPSSNLVIFSVPKNDFFCGNLTIKLKKNYQEMQSFDRHSSANWSPIPILKMKIKPNFLKKQTFINNWKILLFQSNFTAILLQFGNMNFLN